MTAPQPHERLALLLEHARDTFTHLREHTKSRNRLFAISLVAFGALVLRGADSAGSERLVQLALDKLLAPGAGISTGFLAVLLWFAFFATVARYLQAASHVNRQYSYLARVEAEISTIYGSDLLARESTGYLRDYPAFASWMNLIYTWFFPIALMVGTGWTLVVELGMHGISATGVSCLVIAVACMITIVLYIYSSKFENPERARAEPQVRPAKEIALAAQVVALSPRDISDMHIGPAARSEPNTAQPSSSSMG